MKKKLVIFLFLAGSLCAASCRTNNVQTATVSDASEPQWRPIRVSIENQGDSYALMRGNRQYYIKGGGGLSNMNEMVEAGGNSLRTWGTDATSLQLLNEAYAHDLTVTLGLWVNYETHGADYNNAYEVNSQYTSFSNYIELYKNHSALLLWGIGNEVNLGCTNQKVWRLIEKTAKLIHRIDANHPTMTVIAGAPASTIAAIMRYCPDIDILGVNSYGGIGGIESALQDAGWRKPYIITEWGCNGDWESGKTSWGAPIEQTSAEKAQVLIDRYMKCIAGKRNCFGSYVFFWGPGRGALATWYEIFLESGRLGGILNGQATEIVDTMTYLWSGSYPTNRAPQTGTLTIDGKIARQNIIVAPDARCRASVSATDSNNDRLTYIWEILGENTTTNYGAEPSLKPVSGDNIAIDFTAPAEKGNYRLYVYVFDAGGKAAYANCPFSVQ